MTAPSPRVVTLSRRLAATVGIVALPLGLAACGMIGGDEKAKVPVVIPSEAPAADAAPSGSSASTSKAPAAPVPSTVTKTGLVTRHETRVVRTTATQTLPQVTKTPAPITLTETRTETQTQTETRTDTIVSVMPAKTVTKTATKTVTKTVTKKV
jgi:hypothetical protein